jgi:hypothetical protein
VRDGLNGVYATAPNLVVPLLQSREYMTALPRIVLVALVLLLPAALRAQTAAAPVVVALLPASGSNIAPAVLEGAREILRDHLQRTGRYTVIVAPGAFMPEEPNPAQAAQEASRLGAQQAIVLRVTHLGTSARARLTVYAAGSGQVVYWDSIPVAGGPDELDAVLQRLVHALVTDKPVRDSAEIDTVTDKEMQNLNRRSANKSFGVHILTLMPFNTPDNEFRAVPGFGLFWLYDARSWLADLALDFGHTGNSNMWSVSLGGYYPFGREDFAPYLGGVVRLSSMQLGGRGSGGVSFQPTAGFLLGRLSSVQIRGEVGYFVNTFSEKESLPLDGITPPSDRAHISHGFILSVGLGF